MGNIYFHKYLKVSPFALSLWRAFEAQRIADAYGSMSFTRPVLDLGCGFGEFVGVFFDRQVEVGIDINLDDLLRAEKVNKYKKLIMADARNMPFPKNKFSTVISVSVLEHIPQPQLAIKEVLRVLKPGGLFILTVPTVELNDHLFYPETFRILGLEKLRSFYIRTYHKIFKHVNIFPADKWYALVQNAGFEVIHRQGTFSRNTTLIFDLALITALPSQIARWMVNNRWVWGLPLKQKFLDIIFNKLQKDSHLTNSNILIIARKNET